MSLGGYIVQLMMNKKSEEVSYKEMYDEEIVGVINKGDPIALEYLINKYKNLVKSKAKTYYLIGGDKEDIIQEGMIGLYKAIRDYDVSRLSSFTYFADTCITRQIITAIKTATRQKHIPLNSYISLNKPIYEGQSERTLMDTVCSLENGNPEHLMISRECLDVMEKKMERVLSELERDALMSYVDGMSYQEIAHELDRHVKSIDNALQRVKKKMEAFLIEDDNFNS
jgi:RNA polymerase sigma-H factor